jgi:tryptophanyl-tRNA synthetase
MNKRFKLDFNLPQTATPKVGARIMSLTDPTSKMSKSDENKKSTIFILDEDNVIMKKIKSAMTDDENKVYYDEENKPGISNLLTIYASLANISIDEAVEIHKDMNYGEFKTSVAEKIIEVLAPIREAYNSITSIDYLATEEVKSIAKETVAKVEKAMGVN